MTEFEREANSRETSPEIMEAIDEATSNSQLASGTVVEELQKGYIMNGKVLRPAKVKVTK